METNDIIIETVEYYETNARGVKPNSSICLYITAQGDMCAVGRCMTAEAIQQIIDGKIDQACGTDGLYDAFGQPLDELLKPEYRGQDKDFWSRLQQFHDDEQCWGPDGLTSAGESQMTVLQEDFA